MITNGLTNVPAGSSPILINDGATNTTFSNIHDTILPGYTGSTVAMFAFTGSAVSNITVKNITTTRPMFTRLSVVTNLTVDFQRKARISTNGSLVNIGRVVVMFFTVILLTALPVNANIATVDP
ncbi:hypothetical protein ACUODJ_36910, partial [Escherichia sp. HC-CC]